MTLLPTMSAAMSAGIPGPGRTTISVGSWTSPQEAQLTCWLTESPQAECL